MQYESENQWPTKTAPAAPRPEAPRNSVLQALESQTARIQNLQCLLEELGKRIIPVCTPMDASKVAPATGSKVQTGGHVMVIIDTQSKQIDECRQVIEYLLKSIEL